MIKEVFPNLYSIKCNQLRDDIVDQLDSLGVTCLVNLNDQPIDNHIKEYLESTAVLIKSLHFAISHPKVSLRAFLVLIDHLLSAYSQGEKIALYSCSDTCTVVAIAIYALSNNISKEEVLNVVKLYEVDDDSLKLVDIFFK